LSEPSTESNAESRDPRARPRFHWQVALTALLLLLFALRVALPTLAELLLEDIVSDRLGVEFAVDDVDLGFLEGEVAVEGVWMRVAGAERELAHAVRIAIDADWGALFTGELRAESIVVEEPSLFFELSEDGRLNWDELGGPDNDPEEESEDDDASGTFRVSSNVFEIGAGVIHLADHRPNGMSDLEIGVGALRLGGLAIGRETPDGPIGWALLGAEASDWRLGVTPLERELLDFMLEAKAGPTDESGSLPLELNLTRNDGVALTANGSVTPDPLAFDLAVQWQGLSSRSVAPLLLRGVEVERGTAQGSLQVALDLSEGSQRGLRLSGTVRHDDLALRVDSDPRIDIAIERFEGEITEAWLPIPAQTPETPEPMRVVWKRIVLHAPAIDLRLGGGAAAEPSPEAPSPDEGEAVIEAEADPVAETLPLDLTIAELSLREGRLAWHDPALESASEQKFTEVEFTAQALHWPPATIEHAKLVIGSLGSEPLRIEGPLRKDGAALKVRGSGIKLVPWNPLISHYSDYTITGGSLAIKSDFELVGDAYEAPMTVTLNRIRATTDGTGFQSTFGIPLSTAISLLSDPSGKIDIEVPISGKLGADGELRVGVSLVDALREGIMNAITSVLTSPLGVAGSLLAKGHDFAFLRIGEAPFEPGVTALDPAAKEALDLAAAFVSKTPDARLSLSAEIVSADFEAPGAKVKKSKLFENVLRGVFGARRELDARSYTLGLELAKARLARRSSTAARGSCFGSNAQAGRATRPLFMKVLLRSREKPVSPDGLCTRISCARSEVIRDRDWGFPSHVPAGVRVTPRSGSRNKRRVASRFTRHL